MVFAPQGLQDSARRFNAGNIQANGFALQGRGIGGRYQGRTLYGNHRSSGAPAARRRNGEIPGVKTPG
jgi:hypothetical protein